MRMLARALVVALALGLVGTLPGYAQSPTIGFKLGPSFSKMSFDEEQPGQKWLTKFTGGGFLSFDMGAFAFQPELTYLTKGSLWEVGAESSEINLEYVEIPILFVLSPTRDAGMQTHLYAGPAFAYETGCTQITGGISTDCGDDGRKKIDLGAMIGAGLSLPAGPGSILLEARYNFGLRNLSEIGTMRQRTGALLMGYSLDMSG